MCACVCVYVYKVHKPHPVACVCETHVFSVVLACCQTLR